MFWHMNSILIVIFLDPFMKSINKVSESSRDVKSLCLHMVASFVLAKADYRSLE